MTVSRPLLIGLIASATLNVFLVGGVVGVLWVRQTSSPPPVVATSPLPPVASVAGEIAPAPQPRPRQSTQRSQPNTELGTEGGTPGRAPLWTAGQGLSQESRQALRRTLREANRRNQPIVRQARAERQAALQAFRSKAYDPAQAARHLAAARAFDAQARGNVEASLSTFAADLSPEERGALADGLARVYGPRVRTEAAR